MSKNQEVEIDGLIYSIEEEKKTANIIFNKREGDEIIIPRTINYKSIEYTIISISSMAFMNSTNKIIRCEPNSELQFIGSKAFYGSLIETISIPSHFTEFKKGWNIGASNLININIDPNNQYFKSYENNKLILSKSSKEKQNFDVLFLCNKNAQFVTIPNFVEIIESFSFKECKKLKKVEIQEESNLKIIEENSFLGASIECIKIPLNLTKIGKFAFSMCVNLSKIFIPNNSNLQIIESNAFCNSAIESIFIPPHVKKLEDFVFNYCNRLQIIEIDENLDMKLIGKNEFIHCNNSILMVPVKLCHFFNN